MVSELILHCDGEECDRTLAEENWQLVYRTERGERHAYECECGAVTITVHR
jgi:hypothetical protein